MNDSSSSRVGRLPRVSSGLSGLDEILHGGFLKAGVYIFIGAPGAGKTILANQIAFHHARRGEQVLYLSLLAESHSRLFAHMENLEFFDDTQVASSIHYVSGYQSLEQEGLTGLLTLLRRELRERKASLLVLDGLVSAESFAASSLALKKFIHELQTLVSLVGCTAFLLTSGSDQRFDQPEHTMVDGLLELSNLPVGTRQIRTLRVKKFRGSAHLGGAHSFEITNAGIIIYPRIEARVTANPQPTFPEGGRASTGVEGLDVALRGGIERGAPTLLMGPSGSGKTLLGIHYIAAGLAKGERCVYFGFQEERSALLLKAHRIGLDLQKHVDDGSLTILWQPNTENLADGLAHSLIEEVRAKQAARVVVDALGGFRTAVINEERLPRFLSALVHELRVLGTTTCFVEETSQLVSPTLTVPVTGLSSIVDNVLFVRQVELGSALRRICCVIKTRSSTHDPSLREFAITDRGIRFGDALEGADGLLTGNAVYRSFAGRGDAKRAPPLTKRKKAKAATKRRSR